MTNQTLVYSVPACITSVPGQHTPRQTMVTLPWLSIFKHDPDIPTPHPINEPPIIRKRLKPRPTNRHKPRVSVPRPLKYDLAGQVFGMLTVLGLMRQDGLTWWRCRCQCGDIKLVQGHRLRAGLQGSCGKRECIRQLSREGGRPEPRTRAS